MSLTENLKPGIHADQKQGGAGENIPELQWTTVELPRKVRESAMRTVAGRATDATDARLLLDVLGLLPTPAEVTP